MPVTGAADVAHAVLTRGASFAPMVRPAIVNGAAGFIVAPRGRPIAAVAFTVVSGRIARIDVVADAAKLRVP